MSEEDPSVKHVLSVISSKQDRLESKLEEWQTTIVKHFQSVVSSGCVGLKPEDLPPFIEACVNEPKVVNDDARRPSEFEDDQATAPLASLTSGLGSGPASKASPLKAVKSCSQNSIDDATMGASNKAWDSRYRFLSELMADKPLKTWRGYTKEQMQRIRFSGNPLDSTGRESLRTLVKSAVEHAIDVARPAQGINANTPCFVKIVRHPIFDFVSRTVLLASTLLLGITVEIEADSIDGDLNVVELLSHICNIFFILEVLLKILAFGLAHFLCKDDEQLMNMFDASVALTCMVDTVMYLVRSGSKFEAGNIEEIGQTFRTLRVLRVMRIFKSFRFFCELRLLILMITDCMSSLFWAIVLLMIIMYSFAVVFTQNAVAYMSDLQDDADSRVEEMFGTMARTLYYLFQSMLGGISWGEVSDTIMKMDKISVWLFFFYVTFTILAVLNIITGIFVDNALETSRMQREYIVRREEKARARIMKDLECMFDEIDEDGSGSITWDEMAGGLNNRDIAKYFRALGLNINDMHQMFTTIDLDNNGRVDIEEFLDCCSRCTGDAKGVDVHVILHGVRRMNKRLDAVEQENKFDLTALRDSINADIKQLNAWSRFIATQINTSEVPWKAI